MKTMIIAAAAALSLGIGSAYADSEGGQVANTQFTETPRLRSPRRRCRTPRPSRRRRTDRRSTPTSPIRAAAPGCSPPTRTAAATKAELQLRP